MKDLDSLALRHVNGRIFVLDQRRLPDETVWRECRSPEEMARFIRTLVIRGAPLLGVAAAMSLARAGEEGAWRARLADQAATLRNTRPTAVNLGAAIDRVLEAGRSNADGGAPAMVRAAEQIFEEDVALCDAIGSRGELLLADGDNVLTHCNTGGLATAGIGTALGVIRRAHEHGRRIHVYVDETRPLLQGARLTAWELSALGIPYTIICDGMAAFLMQQGKISKVLVGADRIAVNGDFANKVGTYGLAVLARHHGVPFYVAAPRTTIDYTTVTGSAIPIEERSADEVRGAAGAFGNVRWAPADSPVYNPAFDVTPGHLITALIMDAAVLSGDELRGGGLSKIAPAMGVLAT